MAPSPAEAVADEAELGKRFDGRMTVGSCFRAVRVAIPDIEESASCGVNNGKGEVVPGGPTKCQSQTKLHQWKLEASRCPGLSRWLDDNSPTPAFDQIAPRTNPKLVLLDKEERGWSRFRRSWERRLTESRSGSGTRRGSRPLRRRCASAHGTVGRSESAGEGSSDDPCSRRFPPLCGRGQCPSCTPAAGPRDS